MRIRTATERLHTRGRGQCTRAASGTDGTARMAGWSGIVFAGLLVAGLDWSNRIPKLGDSDAVYKSFYGGGDVDTLTVLGLYVVPFAGIACLWHMVATRTLLQVPPSPVVDRGPALAPSGRERDLRLPALRRHRRGRSGRPPLSEFSSAPLPGPDVARALSFAGVRAGCSSTASAPQACTCSRRPGWMRSCGASSPARFVLLSYLAGDRPAAEHDVPPVDPAGVPRLGADGEHHAAGAPARPDRSPSHDRDHQSGRDPRSPRRSAARQHPGPRRARPDRQADADGRGVRAHLQAGHPGGDAADRVRRRPGRGDLRRRPGSTSRSARDWRPRDGGRRVCSPRDTHDPMWRRAHNILMAPFSQQAMRGVPAADGRHRRAAGRQVVPAQSGRRGQRARRT